MSTPYTLIMTQASATLIGWLVQAALFGTIAAALTWLVSRSLYRRLQPGVVAALWSVVLLKFLIPAGPDLPYSLYSAFDALSGYSLTAQGLLDTSWSTTPSAARLDRPEPSGNRQSDRSVLGWQPLVAGLYLTAAASFLWLRLRRYRRFMTACRSLPLADAATTELVTGVSRKLGLRRAPAVRITDVMPAPFVTGLLDPILVLHRSQLHRPDELETLVVHEMSHLRRGDLLVRGLQGLAASIFFFWPVVAMVNRRIDAARELACDQWALRHGTLNAGDYARCLLRVAVWTPALRGVHGPARMAGRISNLERRIDMILQSPQQPAGRAHAHILAVALIIAWGGFVLSGAVDASPGQEVTEQSIKEHTAKIYERIAAYPVADVDGSSEIDLEELNAFLAAVLLEDPDALIECFPYAGSFQASSLTLMDAYDLVRGITYRKGIERESREALLKAEQSSTPQEQPQLQKLRQQMVSLQATEVVLQAQESLLDRMAVVPETETVTKALQYIMTVKKKEQIVKELAFKVQAIHHKIEQLEAEGRSEEADELRKLIEKTKDMHEQS